LKGLFALSYYEYIWDGCLAFLLVSVLLTLFHCAESRCVGLVIYFMVLIGSIAVFGLNAARHQGTEGSSSCIFLGMLFFMLIGLCCYSQSNKPTYAPCDIIAWLMIPQGLFACIVCLFDSYQSGFCIRYAILVTLFGLVCKVSGQMIIEGEKKHYRRSQTCAASQKMYTDIFEVCGQIMFEAYEKGAQTKEI